MGTSCCCLTDIMSLVGQKMFRLSSSTLRTFSTKSAAPTMKKVSKDGQVKPLKAARIGTTSGPGSIQRRLVQKSGVLPIQSHVLFCHREGYDGLQAPPTHEPQIKKKLMCM